MADDNIRPNPLPKGVAAKFRNVSVTDLCAAQEY